MRLALAGLGRMGGVIAIRLRAGGHDVAVYDISEAACARYGDLGFEVASSLAQASAGRELTFLCLPDAAAVATAVTGPGGLLDADPAPPICVDLTSSLPSVTVSLGARLAARGIAFADSPLSGGVAGAAAGRLTAMMGGDRAVLRRAEPALLCFAANLLHAGGLGAGHCVKALNNTLSAIALAATSELIVAGLAHGARPAELLAVFDAGLGGSQNSEVKFPRDILPRSFAAGFTTGLMLKDITTAVAIAAGAGCEVPMAAESLRIWAAAAGGIGPDSDFTRIFEVIEGARRRQPVAAMEVQAALLDVALGATCMVAAREQFAVAVAVGLDPIRAVEIVNAGTGRSQATRRFFQGLGLTAAAARAAFGHAFELASAAGASVPLLARAARQLPEGGL